MRDRLQHLVLYMSQEQEDTLAITQATLEDATDEAFNTTKEDAQRMLDQQRIQC